VNLIERADVHGDDPAIRDAAEVAERGIFYDREAFAITLRLGGLGINVPRLSRRLPTVDINAVLLRLWWIVIAQLFQFFPLGATYLR